MFDYILLLILIILGVLYLLRISIYFLARYVIKLKVLHRILCRKVAILIKVPLCLTAVQLLRITLEEIVARSQDLPIQIANLVLKPQIMPIRLHLRLFNAI